MCMLLLAPQVDFLKRCTYLSEPIILFQKTWRKKKLRVYVDDTFIKKNKCFVVYVWKIMCMNKCEFGYFRDT